MLTEADRSRQNDLSRESWIESKKLWYIGGPAIFTAICQYSLGAITQTFAGHLGTIELAAVAIENSVIAGLAFGTMVSTHKIYQIQSLHVVCCVVLFVWRY